MNPGLSEEMLQEINTAVNKEFKKMTRDKKLLLLNAYSFCYDHTHFNAVLADFYWTELFLKKDPSIAEMKFSTVNRWYLKHASKEGRIADQIIHHLLDDPKFYIQVPDFFLIYLQSTTKFYLSVSEEQRTSINDYLTTYIEEKLQSHHPDIDQRVTHLLNKGYLHPLVVKHLL